MLYYSYFPWIMLVLAFVGIAKPLMISTTCYTLLNTSIVVVLVVVVAVEIVVIVIAVVEFTHADCYYYPFITTDYLYTPLRIPNFPLLLW